MTSVQEVFCPRENQGSRLLAWLGLSLTWGLWGAGSPSNCVQKPRLCHSLTVPWGWPASFLKMGQKGVVNVPKPLQWDAPPLGTQVPPWRVKSAFLSRPTRTRTHSTVPREEGL